MVRNAAPIPSSSPISVAAPNGWAAGGGALGAPGAVGIGGVPAGAGGLGVEPAWADRDGVAAPAAGAVELAEVGPAEVVAVEPASSGTATAARTAASSNPAGRLAAGRAYTALTGRGLDPRDAQLPAGLDPAALVEQRGLGATWPREIAAVSERTGLDAGLLRTAVVDAVDTDADPLQRLTARDRRDDLDRGQHAPSTAADIAARSRPRADTVQPAVLLVDQAVAQAPAAVAEGYGAHR